MRKKERKTVLWKQRAIFGEDGNKTFEKKKLRKEKSYNSLIVDVTEKQKYYDQV